MSHRRSADRCRPVPPVAAAVALGFVLLACRPNQSVAGGVLEPLDPRNPPARIGQTLAEVLSNWGERALFGADCGSWRGPSVDLDVAWGGEPLRLMALLRGDRVAALRYEQTLAEMQNAAQCAAQLDDFERKWLQSGIGSSGSPDVRYDGPVIRASLSAVRDGLAVGSFEADYRQSRAQCRVALIVTQP